jgi:hypothetical protein
MLTLFANAVFVNPIAVALVGIGFTVVVLKNEP